MCDDSVQHSFKVLGEQLISLKNKDKNTKIRSLFGLSIFHSKGIYHYYRFATKSLITKIMHFIGDMVNLRMSLDKIIWLVEKKNLLGELREVLHIKHAINLKFEWKHEKLFKPRLVAVIQLSEWFSRNNAGLEENPYTQHK